MQARGGRIQERVITLHAGVPRPLAVQRQLAAQTGQYEVVGQPAAILPAADPDNFFPTRVSTRIVERKAPAKGEYPGQYRFSRSIQHRVPPNVFPSGILLRAYRFRSAVPNPATTLVRWLQSNDTNATIQLNLVSDMVLTVLFDVDTSYRLPCGS